MRAHSVWRGLWFSAAFPAILFSAPHSNVLTTPAGVRFGIIGEKPNAPAPTVFFLGKAIEDTLDSTYDQEAFETLGPGILKVSLDTPCHGAERRPGEPTSLSGWRYRLEHGDDIAADLVRRATATLDYLIEQTVYRCDESRRIWSLPRRTDGVSLCGGRLAGRPHRGIFTGDWIF